MADIPIEKATRIALIHEVKRLTAENKELMGFINEMRKMINELSSDDE